jgi:hypothetical protein
MSDPQPRIRVINPNSNETVARGLDAALEPLRFENGPEIVCSTLAEVPFGIETQADVESVVMPLRRLVEADNSSDCYSVRPRRSRQPDLGRTSDRRSPSRNSSNGLTNGNNCRPGRGEVKL